MTSNGQSASLRSQRLQDLELDQNQYWALVEEVRQYCETRDRVLGRAEGLFELSNDGSDGISLSAPPFVIDDGETCYSFLREDGTAVPLPYGYELDDDDIALPDGVAIFCTMGPTASGSIRFIPVSPSFSVPDDDAFALERQLINELGKSDFAGLTVQNDIYSDTDSGDLFTGHAVLHWSDGSLRKEADFIDGMLDRKMTWWYESGQKELEDTYVANLRHGTHRAWHDNGQLMSQGESTHGQRQGSWLWWHDNGRPSEETVYVDNEPVTKSTFWYDSGAKKLTTSYLNGLEHGTQTTWFENGQRNTELELDNGVANGVLALWHDNGTQAGEIHVVDGEKHGLETRWDEDGQLIEETNWSHGEVVDLVESEAAKIQLAELVEATLSGDLKEIRRLLKEGIEAEVGPPAFAYAIVANQPKAFEVYVKHGIDVSKQFDWENPDGSSVPDVNAFILAAAGGAMWAVQRLLDLGVDPNFETSMGLTALEIAISGGQDEVVDILFDKMSDVSRPSAGRVLVAAAMSGNTEIASRCLKAGIPVDAIDSRGWSALKYAVSNGNLETSELLLEHGADCNIADSEDWTPLLTAIENKSLEFVNLLLSKGANPNAAPEVEDEDNQKGFSALMRAAHYGEVEILAALIAAGADLAQTDSDGAAAVHYASLHRHPDCLEMFLNHGVDPNGIGADGYSAMGWFLVGLVTATSEEIEIDEDASIATLNLLLKAGGNSKDAFQRPVTDVGDVQITLLDAATFAMKEKSLNDLLKALSRLVD